MRKHSNQVFDVLKRHTAGQPYMRESEVVHTNVGFDKTQNISLEIMFPAALYNQNLLAYARSIALDSLILIVEPGSCSVLTGRHWTASSWTPPRRFDRTQSEISLSASSFLSRRTLSARQKEAGAS